jgi:hypothetical protein
MSRVVVVALLALFGCSHHERAATTTTTAAEQPRPMHVLAVELRGGDDCAYALPGALGFDEDDDLDDVARDAIDTWAVCVGSPRLSGTTVEIGGPNDDPRFDRRAQHIRELLARRGIDAHRVDVLPGTCSRGAIAIGLVPIVVAPDARVHMVP